MARAGATRAEPQGRNGGARDVRHAAAVPADRRGRLPRWARRGRPPGAVEAPSLARQEERTALRLLAAVVAAVAVLAGLIGRAALAGASTPGMASLTRLAGTGAPLAGARTTEAVELANPEPYPCSVTLLPAVARVVIGVAITVPGRLDPVLGVPEVVPETGPPPSLEVTVDNRGDTWLHPSGELTVAGRAGTRRFTLSSATVLPGDRAELSVPLGRVGAGEHLVRVAIPYGPHRVARWQGRVDLPPAAGAATSRPVATARTIGGSAVPSRSPAGRPGAAVAAGRSG